MFHVPAHKNPQPSQRPGQVPLPAPTQAPVQRTIGQRIAARKQSTEAAVAEALEYARACGYSVNSAGGAFVHLYTHDYEFIDGVQQPSTQLNVLHHSRVRPFIDNLN